MNLLQRRRKFRSGSGGSNVSSVATHFPKKYRGPQTFENVVEVMVSAGKTWSARTGFRSFRASSGTTDTLHGDVVWSNGQQAHTNDTGALLLLGKNDRHLISPILNHQLASIFLL